MTTCTHCHGTGIADQGEACPWCTPADRLDELAEADYDAHVGAGYDSTPPLLR